MEHEIKYTYKFRLEPTEEQEQVLFNFASTFRYLYNIGLEQRNYARIPGPVPTFLEIHQKRVANRLAGITPVKKNVNFSDPLVNKFITLQYQGLQLKFLRGAVEWIEDASSPCEEAVLATLDVGFKNFFRRNCSFAIFFLSFALLFESFSLRSNCFCSLRILFSNFFSFSSVTLCFRVLG